MIPANHPISTSISVSLSQYEDKLEEWRSTRYKDSMMSQGVGVDCVRFVVAIADWLHGFDTAALPDPPKLPAQTSHHNATLAWKVVRWMLRRYQPNIPIWTPAHGGEPDIQPGDILCCATQIHPGHAMIAGPRKNIIWHSYNSTSRNGVDECALSWCFLPQHTLLRVWRPLSMRLVP